MNILGLGLPEIIIIAIIVLLFFGKDRLPDLARSIGLFGKELKKGLTDSSEVSTKENGIPSSSNSANTHEVSKKQSK